MSSFDADHTRGWPAHGAQPTGPRVSVGGSSQLEKSTVQDRASLGVFPLFPIK